MNPDGSEQQFLTRSAAEDLSPQASPAHRAMEGRPIAYHSMAQDEPNVVQIWRMNADGTDAIKLTAEADDSASPQWSFDGGNITFDTLRDGNLESYVMDSDGHHPTNLTNSPEIAEGFPSWSHDGSRIVFNSDADGDDEIFVMDADGGSPVQLTENSASDNIPRVSPDGKRVLFVSNRDDNWEVYIMDIDGSNQVNLSNTPEHELSANWSPDGSKIVFASERDGYAQIYEMEPDGSNVRRLTFNSARDTYPAYSADGSQIVFTSDRGRHPGDLRNERRRDQSGADYRRQPPRRPADLEARRRGVGVCASLDRGRTRTYICSGASIPMRRRHRPRTMADAFTSLSLALVMASSPGSLETTRHCW